MTSTYPTQTQPRRIGDLLIFELHPGYQRVSATVKNGSGSTVTLDDPLGYPVKSDGSGGYQLAVATEEASVIGLILRQVELKVGAGVYSPYPVAILVRGPAILNYSQGLPALDYAGASFTISTILTALKALSPPMVPYAEPTLQATQTS